MAKCDLSIELDDPHRVYAAGERVTGRVRVRASEEVNCKSLLVATEWRTHGRGNIAKGKGDRAKVYEGTLEPGREYELEFDLAATPGPSTYHGHYLNIDHYIKAQVDIPWAFDPKEEIAFRVISRATDAEIAATQAKQEMTGCFGKVLGGIVVTVFLVVGLVMLLNPFFWMLALVVGMAIGGWWFFRKFLPARALGQTTWELHTQRASPGEHVSGELSVTPPRDLPIEGVTWKVKATESCTSGSGTNSTTHTHFAHQSVHQVVGPGVLPGGQVSRFEFAEELPHKPLYSVDLSDNKLAWTGELRVAIRGWPDWVQKVDFTVTPGVLSGDEYPRKRLPGIETLREEFPATPPIVTAPITEPAPPAVTFDETARLIYATRDTPEQIDRIIEAVRDTPLTMTANIQRRELFGGRDEHAYPGGYSVRAEAIDPPLPLTLYIRHDEADDFEQLTGGRWQGVCRIMGYCDQRNRLLVRVE